MLPAVLRKVLGLPRAAKRVLVGSFDALAFLSAAMLVQALVTQHPDDALLQGLADASIAAALGVAIIAIGGGYSTIVRFMGPHSPAIWATAACGTGLLWSQLELANHIVLKSGAALYVGVLSFLSVYSVRLGWQYLTAHSRYAGSRRQAVAVYGAGAAGRQLVSALRGDLTYNPSFFIDDNEELHGLYILGLKVYAPAHLHWLVKRHRISQIFLAMPSASNENRRTILDRLATESIRVQTVPHIDRIINGRVGPELLRPIEMEDILGRPPVPADPALLLGNIEGKTVLVTGAGGSIGSELCRSVMRLRPRKLILFEMSEPALFQIEQELLGKASVADRLGAPSIVAVLGNVLDTRLLREVLNSNSVDTVFHAAAYKHVPLVEYNAAEGARNNIFGTKSVTDAVAASGVSTFVLVSTDKAVRPTNVMGASKRVAEMIVQLAGERSDCQMSIVRFGNVLGSSGSVLPSFKAQIEQGGPVKVTHPKVTRYFMTIPEAAQLVIQAGALGTSGDVFHLDMGEPVQILELARRLLSLYGLKERTPDGRGDIDISITGLRPGEKLFEELLIDTASQPTCHPRIFCAQEGHPGEAKLAKVLSALKIATDEHDDDRVVSILVEIVEGFNPYPREQLRITHVPDASQSIDDKGVVIKLRH